MILTKEKLTEINLDVFIESKIISDQIDTILIIVPTNRKLRDLKKKIISNYTNRPVTKINIETLTTFSTKILKNHKNFISLSEAASTVLIKESAGELKLNYFAAYTSGIPFGALDKIKNVISEYKKHGITPSTLLSEAAKLEENEKKKANDIAAIYQIYLEKCKKLSALELGDIYTDLLKLSKEKFSDYFKNLFPDVTTVVVNGFDKFTKPEIEILNSLSEIIVSKMFISFDYFHNNPNLFLHLTDTYEKLKDYGFTKIKDQSPEDRSGFRKVVRRKLFLDQEQIQSDKFKDFVFKVKPKNRLEEIEFIAKTIKLLVLNEKVQPEKMCVAFNVIGNYSGKVRYIFNKYGIPLNLTDRIPLKASSPVIAAVSLLELLEHDFYYHDIARVLTNHFLEFENIDLNNLLSVASELKITGGKNNWEFIIDDTLSLMKYNQTENGKDLQEKKEQYLKAKDDIKQLINLLSPFRSKNTSSEFLLLFKKLLLKLKLPCTVLENSNGKEEEYIKSITVLLQTLNEVLTLVDKNIEGDEKPKYNLSFYLDHIRTITNWARFNVKEKSDYGVLVTSINEIRGLSFDYLFLGGMCDGDFPTKYSPEIFFTGSYQKKEHIHQTEERYHFYQTLCTWKKKLYLTIPQRDNDTELVESIFISDLEKLFLIPQLNSDYPDKILSEEDLQINYGKSPFNEKIKSAIENLGFDIEHINSSSQVRDKRINQPFLEGEYNGFITAENKITSDFLTKYGERQFSISQLETFAKCPFKYFAERILKIKPIEEPTEEAEPIELGNVLHSILYDFYSKVISEKIKIDKNGTSNFEKLKDLLFEIAEEKISKLNLHSALAFFEKEKILGIDGNNENSILFKFLISETESTSNFNPELFEYGFGDFNNTEMERENIPPLEIGKVKLRGKIDRIDINEEEKLFNVIDYKLKGRKPTQNELYDGLSLQLPVYLMAGKHILKGLREEEYDGNEMTIYSLNYKDEKFGPSPVKLTRKKPTPELTKELNKNLLEKTKIKISEYHQNIVKGKFHLSPLEDRETKVCSYCDFKSLCRVKEVFEE